MRGFCSRCGGPYALRRDGTVRDHARFEAGGPFAAHRKVQCEGAGLKPEGLVADGTPNTQRKAAMTPINMNDEKAPTAVRNERGSFIALARLQGATFADVPGRYDGSADRRLAQALDVLDPDEEAGSVDTTGLHLARFGRFVRTTDEQGFVDVIAFETIDQATAKMNEVADVQAKVEDLDENPIVCDEPNLFESFSAAVKADQHFDRVMRARAGLPY